MLIAHIADLHWRGLTRHDEYKQVFQEFFDACTDKGVEAMLICGDIWHTKTQGISPEAIDSLAWFFEEAAKVCPVHMILGNHDMNCSNLSRLDTISPIVKSLNNENLFLYKESGNYPLTIRSGKKTDINLSVFSCFDENTEAWSLVKPIAGKTNIALYHGSVWGAETDDGWQLDGDVTTDFFKDFDFALLGDIHKHQFLTKDRRIAYPGSCIPQNFGESGPKGYLLWDIQDRDNFDVTFHELKSSYPFITLNWKGNVNSTLHAADQFKDGTRFRISSSVYLNQVDIKQLVNELKLKKSASQVVFKVDKEFSASKLKSSVSDDLCVDLQNASTHMRLLKRFYSKENLGDESWQSIESLIEKYLGEIIKSEDIVRNVKWQIKKIEFDNIFVYGKNNVIDFTKLNGITGLFAPNRSGKSSIIGALAYGLFNSTDRGTVKNLHIINSRKGYCKTKVTVGINDRDFAVERQSVRHTSKKTGDEHAVTAVNFFECDSSGDMIRDLNGLQRSDTDKEIRKRIGTFDDFLLTSLSTQFNTNKLISEGASYRKATLARFLGVDIFERLLEQAKKDSEQVKFDLKRFADRNWDLQAEELNGGIAEAKSNISIIKTKLKKLRGEQDSKRVEVAKLEALEVTTDDDLNKQKDIIKKLVVERDGLKLLSKNAADQMSKHSKELDTKTKELNKVSLDELTKRREKKQEVERLVSQLKHSYKHEDSLLKLQKKSLKLLDEVPCGDSFPDCKFIKDSHQNKKKISAQEKRVRKIVDDLEASTREFHELLDQNIEKDIEDYRKLADNISQLSFEMPRLEAEKEKLDYQLKTVADNIKTQNNILAELKKKQINSEYANKLISARMKIRELEKQISRNNDELISQNGSLILMQDKVELLMKEKKEYAEQNKKWHVYELLLNAFSKKGIPAQIIMEQLPVINTEIANILHGSCDFTLVFEAEDSANNMNIYIDYGDSKRLIELGSGMEKIISSLAIRVALNNVSSLPKTNTLIIDEGFGSLDEVQLEACGRFLKSLKNKFRNIIIISHVEAVKDMVDNLLEITKDKKKNSYICYE